MATDMEDVNSLALPSYPEMIVAAITALDEKDGSTKSSIADHLTATYGAQLPAAHASLLAAHLLRMKESGELILINNTTYKVGTAATPAKRGRGRPPKPKAEGADASAGPKRGRGRPPKDPNAPPAPKPAGRGRPPKKSSPAAAPTGAAAAVAGMKRGRGRPPKAKPAAEGA